MLHYGALLKLQNFNSNLFDIGKQINGVWHTGIVVYGEEYYFGGMGGIESCQPVSLFVTDLN
jgi:hypothetical protein